MEKTQNGTSLDYRRVAHGKSHEHHAQWVWICNLGKKQQDNWKVEGASPIEHKRAGCAYFMTENNPK